MILRISFILLTILLAVLIMLFFNNLKNYRNKTSTVRTLRRIFKIMDDEYEQLVENRVVNTILQENSLDVNAEKITDEAFVILKPHLESIISILETGTEMENVALPPSKYFSNVLNWTNSRLINSKSTRKSRRQSEDELKLFNMVKNSVAADISKRMNQLTK